MSVLTVEEIKQLGRAVDSDGCPRGEEITITNILIKLLRSVGTSEANTQAEAYEQWVKEYEEWQTQTTINS